jgi:predicted Mrr-cat superfamily restriction endonuclease
MSDLGMTSAEISPKNGQQKEDKKEEKNQNDQVEMLAREIYTLVRQRFEIERERHGSYYDRRLL